jgi:hypothetical protein
VRLPEARLLKSCQPDLGCGRCEKGVSTMEDMIDPLLLEDLYFSRRYINVS